MRRYSMTLTAAAVPVTITLNEDQDSGLLVLQDGTGGRTIAWSGVGYWFTPTGAVPVLKTAPGAADDFQFFRTGGTVYGLHLGESGAQGATGAAGATGVTWRGAYSSAVTYSARDLVGFNGSCYIALQASSSTNAQQPDQAPTYWGPVAAGGGAGSTEFVDNFTRANANDPSTGGPLSYTKIATIDAHIASNLLTDTDHTDLDCRYRCATVLSSVDHHAQCTLGAYTQPGSNEVGGGVVCRYAAAADTGYAAIVTNTAAAQWKVTIYKIVAGAFTSLAVSAALAAKPVAGDRLKLTCAGTTITAYYNDVQVAQVTDGSITTGGQCGFHLFQKTATETISLSEFRFGP